MGLLGELSHKCYIYFLHFGRKVCSILNGSESSSVGVAG